MWLPLGARWGISPGAFCGRTDLMRKIAIEKLVCDLSLYPRVAIDGMHVEQMRAALRAGATFPPLVICIKTRKVVDGFHRVRAYADEYGEDHEAEVVEKEYPSEKELFLDAIRFNATHGKSMEFLDRAHAIQRAVELGIDKSMVAKSIHVDKEEFCRLSVVPVPRRGNGACGLEVDAAPRSLIQKRIDDAARKKDWHEANRKPSKSNGHVSESMRRDIGHSEPEPERFEKVSSTIVLDRANASDFKSKHGCSYEASSLRNIIQMFRADRFQVSDRDVVEACRQLEELVAEFLFKVPEDDAESL